jgi:flagellar protein FliL
MAAAQAIAKPSAEAGGSSKARLFIEMAAVTAIAVGAALFLNTLTAAPVVAPANPVEGAPAKPPPETKAAVAVVDLPPVVTNLGDPPEVWIRLEASVVIDVKDMPHAELLAGQIASDFLDYLRTLSLPRLEGQVGLQDLKQELSDRARARSGGKVSEILIRTLVVQ